MPIEPTVKIDPDDTVRYLLYQQFYYGDDKIYSRTKDRFEYVKGAGEAIEKFYILITKPLGLIDDGQAEEYLEFFNETIYEIPIKTILDKLKDYESMLGSEMNRGMVLTVTVGESLAEIHKKCFKETIIQLIEFLIDKKLLKTEDRNKIKNQIRSLYGRSNTYIGIVYSLSFMEFISKMVDNRSIAEKCRQLLEKYFNKILNILVNQVI
ncbi:MAG: hypothetical protein ACFFBP_03755 [Promethearchaeota archaeon]